jgi:deazaflavin-dependent oxidoreductase (nitroreductase family)
VRAQRVRDAGFRALNAIHRSAIRLSGGRVGARAFGMAMVELQVPGRTSGSLRTTLLAAPIVEDDGALILVASKGGDARDPEWFHNVLAHPEVVVVVDGRPRAFRASAIPSAEAEELWPRIIATYRPYGAYRARAGREIPLVRCEPLGGLAGP